MYLRVRFDSTLFRDEEALLDFLDGELRASAARHGLAEPPLVQPDRTEWVPMHALYDGTEFGTGTLEFVWDPACQGDSGNCELACRESLAGAAEEAYRRGRIFAWDLEQ